MYAPILSTTDYPRESAFFDAHWMAFTGNREFKHDPRIDMSFAVDIDGILHLHVLVPFGPISEPEEIASPITLLASDDAPYLCGALMEIIGTQAVA